MAERENTAETETEHSSEREREPPAQKEQKESKDVVLRCRWASSGTKTMQLGLPYSHRVRD